VHHVERENTSDVGCNGFWTDISYDDRSLSGSFCHRMRRVPHGPVQKARSSGFGEELSFPTGVKPSRTGCSPKENGPVYPTSNVPVACEIPPNHQPWIVMM